MAIDYGDAAAEWFSKYLKQSVRLLCSQIPSQSNEFNKSFERKVEKPIGPAYNRQERPVDSNAVVIICFVLNTKAIVNACYLVMLSLEHLSDTMK